MAVYRLRNDDAQFAAEWDEAKRIGAESLEDAAVQRARDGWDEPVYFQGACVDTVRKYSDTLLIFLLKGANPEKYRERSSVDMNAKIDTNITDDDLRAELAALSMALGASAPTLLTTDGEVDPLAL